MRVTSCFRLTFAAAGLCALVGLAGTAPVFADDAPNPDTVVATVNGENITERDLGLAAQDLQDSLQQIPPDQRVQKLIDDSINMRLMARAAEAAAIDKDPDTVHLLAFLHDQVLRSEYLRAKIFSGITEDAIKARYDQDVAKFVPTDEIHAEHILVATEDAAKAIIAQLDQGADFATLAKAQSTDTGSGAQGGDLGWFGRGQMVKPFEDAAFALDVGKYTETPVKSDFGWHVIKVLEKRKSAPPTLADRHDDIVNTLRQEAYVAEIDKLRKAATIVVLPLPPAPADNGAGATAPDAGPAPAPDAAPAPGAAPATAPAQ